MSVGDAELGIPPGNADSLPVYLTRFIGRARQRHDLQELLSASRLVTLTGPAGSGKSRLAVKVAADCAARHPDGVWFVDLTSVREAGAVGPAVAIAVGSQEQTGRNTTESLMLSLRRRRALLLLDSCEDLIEACATLVETLLTTCRELHVLTTSIEPLGIPGEANYAVPPLSLPASGASRQALLESEAGELFVERARLVKMDLDLSARNAASIGQICRRLDGLPLALELAAARTRFMPVGELLGKLEDSLSLLKGTSRRVLPRHQTLAATMKWSHEHLSEDERILFRRLSVFVGSFRQDAVVAVCAGSQITQSEVPDLLERLVDKSFLSMEEGKDGSARYRLLRLLRQYGEERLSESGETGNRHLHARHFLTVAEEANRVLLEGGDQAGALSRLEQDHDDVTAALRWALEVDPRLAIRLATAMGYYWRWQGYFRSEGRRILEQAISHAEEGTVAKALALLPLSGIAVRQGDFAAARVYAEQAAHVALQLGDVKILARANLAVGIAAHGTGDLAAARAAYHRVLSLRGWRGREMAGAFNNLAVIEYDEGRYEEARTLIKQALETLAGSRDQLAHSQVLDTALRIDLALLDLLAARRRAAELVKLTWERHLSPVSSLLDSIAILLVNESRPRKALQVAGAAAAVHERIGSDSPPPWLRERDHALSRARKSVGEGPSQRLFALGREMSVESALQLAGLREPASDPLADALADLTDRQRQIAIFVAQGLTNQEIGRRLGISARTVDAHLEHIRNRLEVRSRAEIAAWLSTRTTASATGVGSEPPERNPRRVADGSGG